MAVAARGGRFEQRLRDPLLTDITIDWGALPVADVYPRRIPDLFFGEAHYRDRQIYGACAGSRFEFAGNPAVRRWSREVAVNLPAEPVHPRFAGNALWAAPGALRI